MLPEERKLGGPFRVDLLVDLDHPAVYRDRLADTVDYRNIVSVVARVMNGASRLTLEVLAQDIGRGILNLRGIVAVSVRLTKLSPPLTPGATSAVELELERR